MNSLSNKWEKILVKTVEKQNMSVKAVNCSLAAVAISDKWVSKRVRW